MDDQAGAGGNWPRANEQIDPRALPQERPDYCGCACAQILVRLLGVGDAPSQDTIYDIAGGHPLSVESLSWVMNAVVPGTVWRGIGAAPPDGHNDASLLPVLARTGPWVAHLREPGARLGHFVVVFDWTEEGIQILDPSGDGTRYVMTTKDFLASWTFQVVYRSDT
jgi:hypothetical protein